VAEAMGVTLNAMTILENKGAGTIKTLVTLLVFYYGQGFNPAWVMLPNNPAVSKWVLAENTKAVAVERVKEELNKLKERLWQKVDEIRKKAENA
jgi:hypothetical protein